MKQSPPFRLWVYLPTWTVDWKMVDVGKYTKNILGQSIIFHQSRFFCEILAYFPKPKEATGIVGNQSCEVAIQFAKNFSEEKSTSMRDVSIQ